MTRRGAWLFDGDLRIAWGSPHDWMWCLHGCKKVASRVLFFCDCCVILFSHCFLWYICQIHISIAFCWFQFNEIIIFYFWLNFLSCHSFYISFVLSWFFFYGWYLFFKSTSVHFFCVTHSFLCCCFLAITVSDFLLLVDITYFYMLIKNFFKICLTKNARINQSPTSKLNTVSCMNTKHDI